MSVKHCHTLLFAVSVSVFCGAISSSLGVALVLVEKVDSESLKETTEVRKTEFVARDAPGVRIIAERSRPARFRILNQECACTVH